MRAGREQPFQEILMRWSRNSNATAGKRYFGVTLVELLMAVAMIGIIGLAVYASLNNAVAILRRVRQPLPREDIIIAFDRFALDAKNSFPFTGVDFLGEEERLEFAALVDSPHLPSETVGKVIYFFDRGKKALIRQELDFSQIYNRESGRMSEVLRNVRSLKFEYYFFDKIRNEYVWLQRWDQPKLPLSVKIEVECDDQEGPSVFRRRVDLALGG